MFRPEPQKSHASQRFQKVAAVMEDSQGRIDGDDLIAASFLADPPLD